MYKAKNPESECLEGSGKRSSEVLVSKTHPTRPVSSPSLPQPGVAGSQPGPEVSRTRRFWPDLTFSQGKHGTRSSLVAKWSSTWDLGLPGVSPIATLLPVEMLASHLPSVALTPPPWTEEFELHSYSYLSQRFAWTRQSPSLRLSFPFCQMNGLGSIPWLSTLTAQESHLGRC